MDPLSISLVACACIWATVKLTTSSEKSKESPPTVHEMSDGNFLIIHPSAITFSEMAEGEKTMKRLFEEYREL